MNNFSNETINISDLPKYQNAIFKNIESKYWNVIVMNLAIVSVIILAVVGVVFLKLLLNKEFEASFWVYFSILTAAILFIAFLFVVYNISFKRRSYSIREKDIIYRSGFISLTTSILPYNRIQHLAISEGVFSRMYDLATLEVYTAGGDLSDLKISGIDKDEAYRIKEFLMSVIVSEKIVPEAEPEVDEQHQNPTDFTHE